MDRQGLAAHRRQESSRLLKPRENLVAHHDGNRMITGPIIG
jgi:hemin uptake protein HemP